MQRRTALWTNRSEATKATRAERMRDAQKVRGPRGWVGFGMELETKGSSWTSGERLDTTGTHCYMCVLMQRMWWDSCIHVESSRSRRSRSVSQSVAVGESLTAVLRDRAYSCFITIFFYFLVFHFMRCFNLVIEKLDRENLFRSLTDRDYRASVAECATPGVILEISDIG